MSPRLPALRRPSDNTMAWASLVWDFFIMGLVALNLGLIIFDTLFAAAPIEALFRAISPTLTGWYAENIHSNFITIDLCFVAVFALDVLGSWAVAVWYQTYHRWFFYPFVHWYDVLGCIPLAGFRWLRVLRVIALLMRLQRLNLIDVRQWYVFRVYLKYYSILVEEVSDRVVVNVLEGIQDEVASSGNELTSRVITEVIEPRKQRLVDGAATRIQSGANATYANNQDEIQTYVANLVDRAVTGNAAIAGLERIPMLGSAVTRSIEWAIRDTVNNVLDESVADLDSEEFKSFIQGIADSVFERLLDQGTVADPELQQAIVEIIELLKTQVKVKKWKEDYA